MELPSELRGDTCPTCRLARGEAGLWSGPGLRAPCGPDATGPASSGKEAACSEAGLCLGSGKHLEIIF